MIRHTLNVIETPYDNEVKEGEIKVIYKNGLIKDLLKRVNGELKSIIFRKKKATTINQIIEKHSEETAETK